MPAPEWIDYDALLRRALSDLGNLRSCAARKSRYNRVTAERAEATIRAIASALRPFERDDCLVVVEQCRGYTAKCSCGWEHHHGSRFTARDDGNEHEAIERERP